MGIPATIGGYPVTGLEDGVFAGCTALVSVTIPDTVTTLSQNMFSTCRSQTAVVIPDSATRMGQNIFYYCASLTSVVLSSSLTTLEQQTFYNCDALASVVIPDTEPVNRSQFVRDLVSKCCYVKRRGARHDLYASSRTRKIAPVPRHTEIANSLSTLST